MGGKIYCYANFCYAVVLGPNFREGKVFRGGGGKLPQGHPPVEESQQSE